MDTDTTSGQQANSATTGYAANSATSGDQANSATTGDQANSATTGYAANSATTGYAANSATTGDQANSATTGYAAHSATTGYAANSATSGDAANSATTGYAAHSATTGYAANSVSVCGAAESAQAIAIGRWVRLGPDTIEAIVLPAPGWRSQTVAADIINSAEGEPWPVGVWITMNDDGVVVCLPEVLLPDDGRGYQLVHAPGEFYRAGCRTFTYEQAVKHWSNPSHLAPVSARMLLAEVERHHVSVTA